MTEIMTELFDEIDETIMAEVSDKLDTYVSGIGSYDALTDVDDNDYAAEHNVDLFFSQPKVSILTQPESNGANIEYHFLEEVKSVSGQLVPSPELLDSTEAPSTVTESEIDDLDENAEANSKIYQKKKSTSLLNTRRKTLHDHLSLNKKSQKKAENC